MYHPGYQHLPAHLHHPQGHRQPGCCPPDMPHCGGYDMPSHQYMPPHYMHPHQHRGKKEMSLQRAMYMNQMMYHHQQQLQQPQCDCDCQCSEKSVTLDRRSRQKHYNTGNDSDLRNAFSISNISAITQDSKLSAQNYNRYNSDSKIDYNVPLNSTFTSELVSEVEFTRRSQRERYSAVHYPTSESQCTSSCHTGYLNCRADRSDTTCSEMCAQPHYVTSNDSCSTCRNASSYYSNTSTMMKGHYQRQHFNRIHHVDPHQHVYHTHQRSTGSSSGESGVSSCDKSEEIEESMHALSLAVNTSFSMLETTRQPVQSEDSDSYVEEIDVDFDVDQLESMQSGHCRSSIWSPGSQAGYEGHYQCKPSMHSRHGDNTLHHYAMPESPFSRFSPEGKEGTPVHTLKMIARNVSSSLEEVEESVLNNTPCTEVQASPVLRKSQQSLSDSCDMSASSHHSEDSASSCSREEFKSSKSRSSSKTSIESGSSSRSTDLVPPSKDHKYKSIRKKESKDRKDKALNATHMTACSDVSTIAHARYCKGPVGNCIPMAINIGKQSIFKKMKKISKKMSSDGPKSNQSTFQDMGVL